MTEKKDYFSELEKVAEKLLFPYEIKFKNGFTISKRYAYREGIEFKTLYDWIEYFGVFFENQYQAENGEIKEQYIKNGYFNYSSIVVDFWSLGNDFEIDYVKCYGFNNNKAKDGIKKVDKGEIKKDEFYRIIPFFVDGGILEEKKEKKIIKNIFIKDNFGIELIYNKSKSNNINDFKKEITKGFSSYPILNEGTIANFIGSFIISIPDKGFLETKIHPLKNDFQNEIFGFQNKIQEELFGSLEYLKNSKDHFGGMSDIIDVVYDSKLTLIQDKIDKIIRYIFRISDNPQKERKKILLQDFAKQKLDRNFGKNIIKNQKHLEENDKEYEKGYFKTKDNELNIKNVKQYGYVDEYNTKLNKFIKSKLYEFILKTKKLGLDILNKINPYLNYKHFKDVNLNLSEEIPDSLQQHPDYFSLYKELNNNYDLDIYGLEKKLEIKALDDWFELFCMIRLKEILSSDKAKELGIEIIYNNGKNNLFEGNKIKKEDDGKESRIKFIKGEYELYLTFGANLFDVNLNKGKTPDYTIEIYKNGDYEGIIILDAKYSLQFNKEYNIFTTIRTHIDGCRKDYVENRTFIKKEGENIDSGVEKLILLYPGKFEGSFKINFDSFRIYNKQLLKTGVGIFPINIGDSINFDEYFLKTIINIFES